MDGRGRGPRADRVVLPVGPHFRISIPNDRPIISSMRTIIVLGALLLGACGGDDVAGPGDAAIADAPDGGVDYFRDGGPDLVHLEDQGIREDAIPVDDGGPDSSTDSSSSEDSGTTLDEGVDLGSIQVDQGTDLGEDAGSGLPDVDDGTATTDAGDAGTAQDGGEAFDAGGFLDSGVDVGPPDYGVLDLGPGDEGVDQGPIQVDQGTDQGPPVCEPDLFEPNDNDRRASDVSTVTTANWSGTIQATWHTGTDSDWYALTLARTTGLPVSVTARTPSTSPGWVRVRLFCGGKILRCAGVCGETGKPACDLYRSCEVVALRTVTATVSCEQPDAMTRDLIEITPGRLDVCGYRADFSVSTS